MKKLIHLHEEQVGHCTTCSFYNPPDKNLPGFITDYGECPKNSPVFTKKVCGLDSSECPFYKENFVARHLLLARLRELKGDVVDEET